MISVRVLVKIRPSPALFFAVHMFTNHVGFWQIKAICARDYPIDMITAAKRGYLLVLTPANLIVAISLSYRGDVASCTRKFIDNERPKLFW